MSMSRRVINELRRDWTELWQSKNNIFIHPFTGGSSKTLSGKDFFKLFLELNKLCSCRFILHCDK